MDASLKGRATALKNPQRLIPEHFHLHPPPRAFPARAVEQRPRERVEVIYDRVFLEPSLAVLPFLLLVDGIGNFDCVEVSFFQCNDATDSAQLGVAKEFPEVVADFNEFGNGAALRSKECFQRQFDGMGEKVVAGGRESPLSFWNIFDGSKELIRESPQPCRGCAGFVFLLILQISPRTHYQISSIYFDLMTSPLLHGSTSIYFSDLSFTLLSHSSASRPAASTWGLCLPLYTVFSPVLGLTSR